MRKPNPCPPYRNPDVCDLSLDQRRKVAIEMLKAAIRDVKEPPSARAIRKSCNITARQFRKAVKAVRDQSK